MKAFDSGRKKNHSIVYDFFVIQHNSINRRAPIVVITHFAKKSKIQIRVKYAIYWCEKELEKIKITLIK